MNKIGALAFTFVVLLPVNAIGAQVDLATVLENGGFEDDVLADQWTATKKSTNYRLDAPELDPVIVPKGENDPLEAPAEIASSACSIRATTTSTAGSCTTQWRAPSARARCSRSPCSAIAAASRARRVPRFPNWPPELTLQFFGWKAGSFPFVDPSSDNWSRTPAVLLSQSFTKWAANGDWAVQIFKFTNNQTLQYRRRVAVVP